MNNNFKAAAGTGKEAIKKLNKAYGLSENDAMALLVQASEVQTTDQIVLESINETKKGESTPTKLNTINDEVHLSRNAPPDSYMS